MQIIKQTTFEAKSIITDHTSGINYQTVLKNLETKGFAVLHNLFDNTTLDQVISKINKRLEEPAIAGSSGYYVVDYPRKMLTPSTIIEGKMVDFLVDERIIKIIEALMQSECVLAETGIKFDRGSVGYEYFPIHCDYWEGWSLDDKFQLTQEHLKFPIAVGSVFYLHDTTEGCFCYLEGSHKFRADQGDRLINYPSEKRKELLATKVRITGKKGDVILFDSRGFHGPDQPSKSDRLAVISRYYRVKTFGYVQASPLPLWTSDIGRLSPKQLEVLGVGSKSLLAPELYFGNRIKMSIFYPLITKLVKNAFILEHWNQVFKTWLSYIKNVDKEL